MRTTIGKRPSSVLNTRYTAGHPGSDLMLLGARTFRHYMFLLTDVRPRERKTCLERRCAKLSLETQMSIALNVQKERRRADQKPGLASLPAQAPGFRLKPYGVR